MVCGLTNRRELLLEHVHLGEVRHGLLGILGHGVNERVSLDSSEHASLNSSLERGLLLVRLRKRDSLPASGITKVSIESTSVLGHLLRHHIGVGLVFDTRDTIPGVVETRVSAVEGGIHGFVGDDIGVGVIVAYHGIHVVPGGKKGVINACIPCTISAENVELGAGCVEVGIEVDVGQLAAVIGEVGEVEVEVTGPVITSSVLLVIHAWQRWR